MQKCTPWPGQAYSLFAYVSKTSNLAWLDWIRSRESGAQRFVHATQNQCWGTCDYLIFSTIILPIVVRKGATDAPYTIADIKYRWTDVSRTYIPTQFMRLGANKVTFVMKVDVNIISSYLYFLYCPPGSMVKLRDLWLASRSSSILSFVFLKNWLEMERKFLLHYYKKMSYLRFSFLLFVVLW